MEQEYLEFNDVTCKKTTDMAGLFEIDGEEYWIPWSQISDDSVDKDGETGDLFMTEWIAKQKGLG